MEKVNIAVAFKDGSMEILATGSVDEVLAAYKNAEKNTDYDFVGMLRKPVWYKRNTPKRNVLLDAARQAHLEQVEIETAKASGEALSKQVETLAIEAAQAAAEEAAREAIAKRESAKLNEGLAAMEQSERDSAAAAKEAELDAIEASKTPLAPTAEEEKKGKKK